MQKRSFTIFALIALAGFAIGLAAASHHAERERHARVSETADEPQSSVRGKAATRVRPMPHRVQEQVEGLLNRARSGGAGSAAAAELQRTVDRWLLADPLTCITWLHDRGASGLVSRELFQDVFVSALGGDSVLAIRVGAEISDPILRRAWLRSIFEVAKESEPKHALDLVAALPSKIQGDIAKDVISAWAAKDGPAAWNAVVGGNRRDHHALAAAALHAWAEADPSAVQDFVRLKVGNSGRGKEKALFFSAVRALAENDTSRLVLQSLVGAARDPAFQSIWMTAVASAAEGDLVPAIQIIDREPPGLRRDAARAAFAQQAVRTDLARGLEIAATLPSYASRRAVFHTAISDLLKEESKSEEAAILAQSHSDPLLRAEQIGMVTSRWLEKDCAAFLQFVLAQPDGVSERWLDELARRRSATFGAGSGSPFNEAQRARLQRELAARLPPDEAATMLERLLGK